MSPIVEKRMLYWLLTFYSLLWWVVRHKRSFHHWFAINKFTSRPYVDVRVRGLGYTKGSHYVWCGIGVSCKGTILKRALWHVAVIAVLWNIPIQERDACTLRHFISHPLVFVIVPQFSPENWTAAVSWMALGGYFHVRHYNTAHGNSTQCAYLNRHFNVKHERSCSYNTSITINIFPLSPFLINHLLGMAELGVEFFSHYCGRH